MISSSRKPQAYGRLRFRGPPRLRRGRRLLLSFHQYPHVKQGVERSLTLRSVPESVAFLKMQA